MLRGLDVSSVQGVIDWSKVPAIFDFIVVKASEGPFGQDPMRIRNIQGAEASGRTVFAYHYFYTSADAIQQAKNIKAALGNLSLRSFIDFETLAKGVTPDQAIQKVLQCADMIGQEFGYLPGLYTYPWFEESELGKVIVNYPVMGSLPLWMADYSGGEFPQEPWHPFIPKPWTKWTMAQTSGNNSSYVPGIPGHVDHDNFNGSLADLAAFAKGA